MAELLDRRTVHPPVLDTAHLGALEMVARGEIGAYGPASALRHRTDDLGVLLVSALFTLRRDGFVGFGGRQRDPRDGWVRAVLTPVGVRLLEMWVRRGRADPDDAARVRDWFVLLRCAQRGDLGVGEHGELLDRGAPVEPGLTARMRELFSAGHLRFGSRLGPCRMVVLSDTGRGLHGRLDLTQTVHG